MLRPSLLRTSIPRVWKRNLQIPTIRDNFRDGIPDFLSPQGVDIAWNQYQTLMITRLNDHVAGTAWEDKWPKDIAIATAREPAHASTFNYASMAHNNHFFFDGLSPHKTEMPKELEKSLIRSFSSLETLRREFIITVNAMFGPGFVWLVYKTPEASQAFQSRTSEYALLTTYLAGSPYPAAHWRRQSTDMNTENEPPVNTVGAMGKHSMSSKIKQPAPGGFRSPNSIVPLLCINTWEHVWLPDYGVGGKWAYTENWWERINWEKVHENNQPTELLK